MRKLIILVIVILIASLLSGCVETTTSFFIREDRQADVEFLIVTNKIFAGDEVSVFVWCLTNSFPELQNNYKIKKEVREIDHSDYLIYTFQNKEPFNIDSNKFVEFKREDDKYSFKLKISPLIEKVDEDNEDDLMFTFKVFLPKKIDIANSHIVEHNSVTWKITMSDLVKGVELKASTK